VSKQTLSDQARRAERGPRASASSEVDYLTTQEVATYLRTSPETVRYWRYTGVGPKSWKCGRRVLYALDDLEAWIKESRDKG
jgi:excisionase family DNA binding protein